MKGKYFALCMTMACASISCTSKTTPVVGKIYESLWNGFDFGDTAMVDNPGITEPRFVEFCKLLEKMEPRQRSEEVDSFLSRSLRGSEKMYWGFMELAEKYLADPNSPYRDEETFIPFLEHAVRCKDIDSTHKERPRYLLSVANMNRKGTQAADIQYVTREGNRGRLSDVRSMYTLLYFNNPDCHDCNRVFGYLTASRVFASLQSSGKLRILALYPDEDLASWDRHKLEYPSQWIAARYATEEERKRYNLPAIPNIYLLDKDRNVLLKDASVEEVEEFLRTK